MSEKAIATRMFVKPGDAVLAVDAPDDYAGLLGQLPSAARVVGSVAELGGQPADVVHVFANTRARLADVLPQAMKAVRENGILWVSYPKVTVGGHDLSRQAVHNDLHTLGWKPVAQIAIDDTWSAIRARPATEADRRP